MVDRDRIIVPTLGKQYVIANIGRQQIVVGKGKPSWNINARQTRVFGGWAWPPRNTESDDYHVVQWLSVSRSVYYMLLLTLVYVIMLWAVLLLKISVNSLRDFDMFFTNWSWTLQSIFYSVDAMCFLDESRYCHYLLLLVAWWPIMITVVAVFILVNVVIFTDDTLFVVAVKQYGVADMILGHTLVHIIPLIVVIMYGYVRSKQITESIAMLKDSKGSYGSRLLMYIMINYIYPILIVVAYLLINDYTRVYHVRTNAALAVPLVIVLYMVIYVIGLAVVFPRTDRDGPSVGIRTVLVRHAV